MSFPRYGSYKESGVEWLGEVPEHWEVLPLKCLFKIVGGSTPKSDQEAFWDGDIIWVTPSDLSKRLSLYIGDSQRKITLEGLASCGTSLVPKNSIILSTRAPIGSLAIAETDLCTNQGCKSLVPSVKTETKLFGYLLSISSGELNIRGKGTTFLELSGDELGAFKVPVPPNQEQQTIAAFLDRETIKIDALIDEQQRLIGLLKEKRQSVISHAVTKGLNPHVPMKDSGVEWLGDVPEHWEVKRLKRLLRLLTEKTNRRDNPIALENIQGWSGRFIPTETEFEGEGIAFERGDILFGKLRPYLAKVYLAETTGEAVGDFHVMRPTKGIDSRFSQYQILNREFIAIVDGSTFGAKMPRVSWDFLSNMVVATPPIQEQQIIAAFLDIETAKLATLTTEAKTAISLLLERRTALISAAVTGKIDVRGLVRS